MLAIAPYEGLRDLIVEEVQKRNDIVVEAYVADMLDGRKLVESLNDKHYDFIISRAGTAELIREVIDTPVIDIKISVLDMISAINLAQNYSGDFAIVGFRSITENAVIVSQINGYSLEIRTLNSYLEIEERLIELKNKGISLIVGDVITSKKARNLGLNTILITSGKESVLNSFDEAINFSRMLSSYKRQQFLMNHIVANLNTTIIVLDKSQKVIFTNDHASTASLFKITRSLFEKLEEKGELEVIQQTENHLLSIRGECQQIYGEKYAVFYFDELKSTTNFSDPAIQFINASDEQKGNLEIISTNNERLNAVLEDVKLYTKTKNPLMMIGEKGTGKDTIAHMIHKHTRFNKNPFSVIDVRYMNKKKWLHLLEGNNSFLTKSDITIYIKNLQMVDSDCQQLLESYFINTHIHKRNKFIFSYVPSGIDSINFEAFLHFIQNELGAFPLVLPSLNERKEDIPSLSSLFISDFILKNGKQVFGLEPAAIELLKDFKWTSNIEQLKRVIKECTILTDTYYINENIVKRVLENESVPTVDHDSYLDFHKPLDEITKDIINLILSQENFNQTNAAKRLGISRSTLWRKLK